MGLYTDAALAKTFPSMEGLSHEEVVRTTEDAEAVYRHVARAAGSTEAEVRAWGESRGIDPDRMTAALALLREGGKLYVLPDAGPIPTPEPDGETPASGETGRRSSRSGKKRTDTRRGTE